MLCFPTWVLPPPPGVCASISWGSYAEMGSGGGIATIDDLGMTGNVSGQNIVGQKRLVLVIIM